MFVCYDTTLRLSYFLIFYGDKLQLFLYLSQFLGTITCIRRAVLHIRPCPTPTAFPFQKELSVRNTSGGCAPSSQPLLETTIFSLTVHAHLCYQSENIFSKCLLSRVIDLIVFNRSICYDNNANRITF